MFSRDSKMVSMALATAVVCSLASITSAFKLIEGSGAQIIPGRFIVAVSSSSSSSLGKRADEVIAGVINKINDVGIDAKTRKTYQSPGLLTGASIVVPENTTAADLLAVPGVTKVWPVRSIPRPVTYTTSEAKGKTSHGTSATDISARGKVLSRRDAYTDDTWSPHQMTGVDVMHGKGFLGSGIRVAILDTGVDYKNPILGGCFGKGCKVAFGYAFVGDYDETTTGPDPYTNCSDHGTHVTGIIGANANSYGFTGVAPQATIGMYRVFSCSGNTGEDTIVEALLKAAEDRANVINMSLGGPVGWLDGSPTQALVERLNAKGIVTMSAAGNEQSEGMFFAEFPAASRTGVAVASVDVANLPAYDMVFKTGGYPKMPYLAANAFSTSSTLKVYFTSTDTNALDDACNPLPLSTPDLRNYLVIMQRGTCNFATKMGYAADKGARFAMIYNSATGATLPYFGADNTGLTAVAGLRREDGLLLLKYYLAQKKKGPSVTFPSNSKLVSGAADTQTGGQISAFSNFGPTNDMYGQPSFAAPGGNILSTFPIVLGTVGVLSGTSMATPFAAGSAALLLSARKSDKLTPEQVRFLFASTANVVPVSRKGSQPLTTTLLQGGGLIQVDQAYAAKSFISPFELMLNDTAHFNNTQTITITNKNSKAVTYRYVNTPAQVRATYDTARSNLPSLNPAAITEETAAGVSFRPGRITIPAGQTSTVRITFQAPKFVQRYLSLYPMYSGFITITADDPAKQKFQIPYFGMAGNMSDMQILDKTSTYADNYQSGLKYPFITDGNEAQTANRVKDYPIANGLTLYFRLALFSTYHPAEATRAYNVDLVFANTTFKPTVLPSNNANLRRRSLSSEYEQEFESLEVDASEDSHILARSGLITRAVQSYASTSIVGRVSSSHNQPRDWAIESGTGLGFSDQQISFTSQYQTTPISGVFAEADTATPYRLLLRTLKTTADPKVESSWESWLSPPFTFSILRCPGGYPTAHKGYCYSQNSYIGGIPFKAFINKVKIAMTDFQNYGAPLPHWLTSACVLYAENWWNAQPFISILIARKMIVLSDNSYLKWFLTTKEINDQQARAYAFMSHTRKNDNIADGNMDDTRLDDLNTARDDAPSLYDRTLCAMKTSAKAKGKSRDIERPTANTKTTRQVSGNRATKAQL
ncbi:BQ5605_C016g08098 [Microbotryum silenes-dioicae]|uniref:BQ5605_C016g08098 protein n=1 Tax=Microbotryum silenes-dioicae TaxID=796604 RepID=A0A2X0LVG9_9BASI|nr:BQ5605_C016g08098 [Microbotryum silenes-dioicae]